MNQFEPQLKRIRDDVQNGGSLGKASALRLLDLMGEMAQEIDALQRRFDRHIEHKRELREMGQ